MSWLDTRSPGVIVEDGVVGIEAAWVAVVDEHASRGRGKKATYQVQTHGEQSIATSFPKDSPVGIATTGLIAKQIQRTLSLIETPKSVHKKLSVPQSPEENSQSNQASMVPASSGPSSGSLQSNEPLPKKVSTKDNGAMKEGVMEDTQRKGFVQAALDKSKKDIPTFGH
ncbi:hypothetical protein Cgig2_017919 [Carnegiea gigantea]|uniref:Uncharacterized protein n=1 Tax=Carnegiea gigantea TaxID=171969 RepID=A0A9Q1QDK0_9CARY|nr:hypothetical protein Cgig2_017919 [Carnegiea gigantea]